MVTLAEPLDQTLFARSIRIGRRGRGRGIFSHLLHFLPQAEGPHIGPDFLNVSQAFGLLPNPTNIFPPEWILFVLRPYRVLLFVVNHYFVNSSIFSIRIVPTHF